MRIPFTNSFPVRNYFDSNGSFGLSEFGYYSNLPDSKTGEYRRPDTYVECAETLGSGSIVFNRDGLNTCSRELKITGTYRQDVAMNIVHEWLDCNDLWYDSGIPLKSQNLQADQSGAPVFTCNLEYSDATQEKWIDEIQITTIGGSAHIDTAKCQGFGYSTIKELPTKLNYGKIGIDMDGQPQGVDVKDINVQITVTINRSFADFNKSYFGLLLAMSPSVNATGFWGFARGELLFEGVNVDRVQFTDTYDNSTCYRWRIQYIFYAMPNVNGTEPIISLEENGKSVGLVPWHKNGWDYKWQEFTNYNFGGQAVQLCRQVNVDRVYNYDEFRKLGLPSNMFTLGESIDYTGDSNDTINGLY